MGKLIVKVYIGFDAPKYELMPRYLACPNIPVNNAYAKINKVLSLHGKTLFVQQLNQQHDKCTEMVW